jgi:hypothetical protein
MSPTFVPTARPTPVPTMQPRVIETFAVSVDFEFSGPGITSVEDFDKPAFENAYAGEACRL